MSKRKVGLVTAVAVLAAAGTAYAGAGPLGVLGAASMQAEATYQGFYDGHKDTYVVTDVSSKGQASALHVNYSAELKAVKGAPAQYFIKGKSAAGQIAVFGSEPGKSDYNPLWEEFFVTWKAGGKPVLLVKDDQIKALAKAGKVSLVDAHVVLNAPILKVGK